MRLLDTDSLQVVEVRDDSVPDYAILSHTWGDEEITIQDMQSAQFSILKTQTAFLKIQNSASLAKKDGHQYIWIDTCCIDKTSSAELSEAINSMYRWYERAIVCYAYLSDVESQASENPLQQSSTFQRSRWFTRGWTLQELIAPKDIFFFARDWTYLGRKRAGDAFSRLLSFITGVDEGVLDGSITPDEISVANRMKWASYRETTRVEDITYCLMGIFDVNMPLLYGEGDKAFIRLQEEILKKSNDQSLFAWKDPNTNLSADTFSGLLAKSPLYFQAVRNITPPPSFHLEESIPSSITNQGLHVQLYLRPQQNDIFHAILDCSIWVEDQHRFPAIFLRKIWGDQFTRIDPAACLEVFPLSTGDILPGEGYKRVYVKQNPVHFIPDVVVARDDLTTRYYSTPCPPGREHMYNVVDIYPQTHWDPINSMLKAPVPRPDGVFAVLRFANPTEPSAKVDVIIGVRRHLHRWEPWCHKICSSDDSVKFVYRRFMPLSQMADTKYGTYHSLDGGRVDANDPGVFLATASITEIQRQGRLCMLLTVLSVPELPTNATPSTREEIVSSAFNKYKENVMLLTSPCCEPDRLLSTIFSDPRATTRVRVHPQVLGLSFIDRKSLQKRNSDAIDMWRRLETRGQGQYSWFDRLDSVITSFENLHPLHWAVSTAHRACIHQLLSIGTDPATPTPYGWSVAHIASFLDSPTSFEAVFSANSDFKISREVFVDARCYETLESPIHFTAAYASWNPGFFLNQLLDPQQWAHSPQVQNEDFDMHSVSVQHRNFLDGTSIHRAEMGPVMTLGQWAPSLQDQNEDFDIHSVSTRHRNFQDETPLHRAAAMGNVVAATRLLEYPHIHVNDVDKHGRSILWHAACSDNQELIKLLVSHGARINFADDIGRTPLHVACLEGRVQSTTTLLSLGADPNHVTHPPYLTPCHYASLFGHLECLQALINGGANFGKEIGNSLNFQPIHLAAANGHLKCVNYLLEAGCNVDVPCDSYILLNGYTTTLIPLPGILFETDTALAKVLLEEKEKMRMESRQEHSAVWIAADNGHLGVAKTLLRSRVQGPGESSFTGQPEFRRAVKTGRKEVVGILLDTGQVDAGERDEDGQVALHIAAMNGYEDIARVLLKRHEVDKDVMDKLGRTPLWLAAQKGYTEIARMLLDSGEVDVNVRDDWGEHLYGLQLRKGTWIS
ncbi:hypothetical protein F4803DRAFT_418641 [Xylaria telfairii]|nr:hypothetical protein F4803DRAFT_418641 [Xylaria telfairii]